MNKFALLSHTLPPSPSGQSVILFRILSKFDPSKYLLLSSQKQIIIDTPFNLDAQTIQLPMENLRRITRSRVLNSIFGFYNLIKRTKSLFNLIKKNSISSLIACTGDFIDIPSGYIASRLAGISFYSYIFDDYVYQWLGYQRLVAQFIASFIFRKSKRIIVTNSFIKQEYQTRYKAQPTLVINPCDENQLLRRTDYTWPAKKDLIKVFYSGSIYHANYDCFINMKQSIEILNMAPIEFHLFTSQTKEDLISHGIYSDKVIIHSHISYSEILERQEKADILYLPLGFDTPIPEVIRTSSPGKLGEYLASGRPILAHVPADSFVANYCAKHACAALVTQNNPHILAQEMKNIIINEEFRLKTIMNARKQAFVDFNPINASKELRRLLKDNDEYD